MPPAREYATLAFRMAKRPQRSIYLILGDARRELGMSQEAFGYAVGSSHRTAVRWDARESTPAPHHLHTLARLLHPRSRSLAVEVAEAAEETLVSLGLEAAPAPPPTPMTSPVAAHEAPAPSRPEDLVDVVVLAAVELTGSPPAAVRPLLHAVFKRGREVGLTMEAAEKALRPPGAGHEQATAKKAKTASTKRGQLMAKQ